MIQVDTAERSKSYGQILKCSFIVGGAQIVSILVGMVRTKFVAILLGPTGVGLNGTYMAITGLVQALTGLGMASSGVREVAEACGSSDTQRVARTVLTLRRMVWLTGLCGALVLIVLAIPISVYTFKGTAHTVPLVLLSAGVFLTSLTGGQSALLQGARRIGDLARMTVIGVTAGSAVSIALYYIYGTKGIVPALIMVAALQLAAAWWFARRVPVPSVSMSWRESLGQAGGLVRLGMALMWSGLLTAFVAYLTRAMISRQIGLAAIGIFQAAFGLSGLFSEFVLRAMGADFYPRLTAVSSDDAEVNRLVSEQTEIGLLLAVPGLIATIVVAPWVIDVFYTAEFLGAADLMRWFVFGCLGRVISWPMGFILLAKGESRLYFAAETLFGVAHAALIWIGLRLLGLFGVALAFVLAYAFCTMYMSVVCRRLTGFRWTWKVWALLFVLVPSAVSVLLSCLLLAVLPATLIGGTVCISVSVYCVRQLGGRLGSDHRVCKVISRIPIARVIAGVRT